MYCYWLLPFHKRIWFFFLLPSAVVVYWRWCYCCLDTLVGNPFHGRKHQQQQQYPSASHRIPIPLRPHPTPSMSNVYVCCVLRCPRRGVSIRSFLLVNLACEARSLPLSGYSHAFACVAMCSVRRQWNEYVPQHRDVAHRATANWDDLDLWQLWKARYQNEREFLSFGVICHRVVLV